MAKAKKCGKAVSVTNQIRNIDRKIKRRQDARDRWSAEHDSAFPLSAAYKAIAQLDREIAKLLTKRDDLVATRGLRNCLREIQLRHTQPR